MEPTVSPDTTTATSNKRSDSDAHPVDGDSPVQAVTDVGFWWHSIDLNGVLTPGGKSAGVLQMEWQTMQVPDLAGKTVLDIGAWDGYFSFQAEQHGAREVTALDHYVWSIDRKRWGEYHEACKQAGKTPLPVEQTEYWDPKGLPGKRGFDLACRVRNSKVKSIVRDYMGVSPDEIGTFDVVLYLGVFYHMRNPLEALLKVASLTRELAVIETHAVEIYGHDVPLAEFYRRKGLQSMERRAPSGNRWLRRLVFHGARDIVITERSSTLGSRRSSISIDLNRWLVTSLPGNSVLALRDRQTKQRRVILQSVPTRYLISVVRQQNEARARCLVAGASRKLIPRNLVIPWAAGRRRAGLLTYGANQVLVCQRQSVQIYRSIRDVYRVAYHQQRWILRKHGRLYHRHKWDGARFAASGCARCRVYLQRSNVRPQHRFEHQS